MIIRDYKRENLKDNWFFSIVKSNIFPKIFLYYTVKYISLIGDDQFSLEIIN